MYIAPPNDTSVIIVRYLYAELYIQLVKILVKLPINKNNYVHFVFAMLGYIVEKLALALYHDRSNLAEILGKHQMGCHYA